MLDGFYALFYTGKVSSGFAMIVLRNGIVTGEMWVAVSMMGNISSTRISELSKER